VYINNWSSSLILPENFVDAHTLQNRRWGRNKIGHFVEQVLLYPHVNHSGGRKRHLKRPKTVIEWSFIALILTVFHRNPSSRITGRFFARNRPPFSPLFLYISGMTDYNDVLTPFETVYGAVFFDLSRTAYVNIFVLSNFIIS
jgi:hypothetical protein